MRVLRWSIVVVAAVLALLRFGLEAGTGDGGGTHAKAARGDAGDGAARVVRVVDGDTIVVSQHGREDRVRYIGVDTPETVKPGAPVGCFGHEASRANTRLVEGRTVRLEVGEEPRDRYGRLLAYVYAPGERFVNEELVAGGYARTLTIRPNDRYASRFARLEREARSARRGLWGACDRG